MADPTTTERARSRHLVRDLDDELEQVRVQRTALKDRHAQALAKLMAEREDLKGVHALADLVSDSLRWSA